MNSYQASINRYHISFLKEEEIATDPSWIEPQLAPKWLFSENVWDITNPQYLKDVLEWENVDNVLEVGVLLLGKAVYSRTVEEQEISHHGRGRPVVEKIDKLQRTVGDIYRLFVKVKDTEGTESR